MKKEDFPDRFTPIYKPARPIKISDNIITNDDMAEHQPAYIARSNPESKEAKREVSWINLFFRDGFALLRFKPYNNYHIAIRAVEAYCGFLSHELKVNEDDLEKTSESIISCCFLLKFLLTIDSNIDQGKEFRKSYSFELKKKVLWPEYKWRLRYQSQSYKFEVQSGSLCLNLQSQIYRLLADTRFKYPRKRAEDLFLRVFRIAESTRLDDGF